MQTMHFCTTQRAHLQTYKYLHQERKKKAWIPREVAERQLEPCDFLFKNLFPTPVQVAARIQGSPYYYEKKMRSRSKCVRNVALFAVSSFALLNNCALENNLFCYLRSKLGFPLSCIIFEGYLGSSKSLNQKALFRI